MASSESGPPNWKSTTPTRGLGLELVMVTAVSPKEMEALGFYATNGARGRLPSGQPIILHIMEGNRQANLSAGLTSDRGTMVSLSIPMFHVEHE